MQRGSIPLTTALEIARAGENATECDAQVNLSNLLQEAYKTVSSKAARSSKPSA